jgi:hypothetical protein
MLVNAACNRCVVWLTVILLDASSARVATTTTSPALATALAPDLDGTGRSSEDGRRGDELLHCGKISSVVEVLELRALPAIIRGME